MGVTEREGIIPITDLRSQYLSLKKEIDKGIEEVIASSAFIGGSQVRILEQELAAYAGVGHVVSCANGTDALQMAMMALGLEPGDEIIVPAFAYVSPAEAAALLRLKPVFADVDPDTFNITAESVRKAVTPATKAVVAVHLFGQPCDMPSIAEAANDYGLHLIEDNAQSLGATFTDGTGTAVHAGTAGAIGCTSFFPSKNLGCFGDGGAMFTDDDRLAARLRMIAGHGQAVRYRHETIGCNSRLDGIQAAVLRAKLPHLDAWNDARRAAADYYTAGLRDSDIIQTPVSLPDTRHVYHQYTVKVAAGMRDGLKDYLAGNGIASAVYYPMSLDCQPAFSDSCCRVDSRTNAAMLAECVLSLPMHPFISRSDQDAVIEAVRQFSSKCL